MPKSSLKVIKFMFFFCSMQICQIFAKGVYYNLALKRYLRLSLWTVLQHETR